MAGPHRPSRLSFSSATNGSEDRPGKPAIGWAIRLFVVASVEPLLLAHRSRFHDYFDPEWAHDEYYAKAAPVLKEATGALEVFIFDHNVRNKPRSDRGDGGVRMPVEGAHNDYTLSSGPRRIREVLEEHKALDLVEHRGALVNLWRPIVGPVQDHPLAICYARAGTRQRL
jgi:hypothetical protein